MIEVSMGNFIPNEKVHECLICHNFYGMRTRLWNHVESEHNITKDEYMWKYVYEHDGEPKCIECGKSIHYNKWNRDILFCSVSCILTYNHRVNPGLWIDNNGNYCPENCKWISLAKQARNKRNNHLITYNGETKCMAEWAEIVGIKQDVIKDRLNRYNWTVEEALGFKKRIRRGKNDICNRFG